MTRPEITIIVACTRDFGIGKNGDLLFHLREDLRHFKNLTMGHPIVMGRKTFESFPNGALPGRRNIVITRNPAYSAEGIETVSSIGQALDLCSSEKKIFIIGGGEIYKQSLPMADNIELTLIDAPAEGADTFFPELDPAEWDIPADIRFDHVDQSGSTAFTFLNIKKKDKREFDK